MSTDQDGGTSDADRRNPLGAFLRARREQLDPAEYQLPASGRRQTGGLRREEVALLAGMSSHYYTRLEQGRDRHPSPQVLDSLARVLHLDTAARHHLTKLVEAGDRGRRRRRPATERVRPQLQQLLDQFDRQPAIVLGRLQDVLAANALAVTLNPLYTPGRNLVRDAFLHPDADDVYLDREQIGRGGVAALRASAGADVDDPRLNELVGELSTRSEDFRQLWARHDVQHRPVQYKRFGHPLVGPITLAFEPFVVPGSEQTLCVFFAPPGTDDAQSLRLVAQLGAESVGAG